MALAALAGCYHAGALVVPSKPASVAAAVAATSPSPDLQIQRIFPASISKEISSPTSSVKLNGVLIASNAIGSASTNAAQAYWLAEMMSARFAEDPVWYNAVARNQLNKFACILRASNSPPLGTNYMHVSAPACRACVDKRNEFSCTLHASNSPSVWTNYMQMSAPACWTSVIKNTNSHAGCTP